MLIQFVKPLSPFSCRMSYDHQNFDYVGLKCQLPESTGINIAFGTVSGTDKEDIWG